MRYIPDPPPLVGRKAEQQLLRDHVHAASGGRGRLVLIGGQEGIGKTALISDLLDTLTDQPVFSLSGHCYKHPDTSPYAPWTEIIDRYQSIANQPDALHPFLHGQSTHGSLHSQTGGFASFWTALREIVSQRSLLILVLEDLHWADLDSLELLRYCANRLSDQRLLIIGTYRLDQQADTSPFADVLTDLARGMSTTRIDLTALPETAISHLVTCLYQLDSSSLQLLTRYLVDKTRGVPFFTIELLRHLEQTGVLHPIEERWVFSEPEDISIPPLVEQVLQQRLEHISTQTVRLLSVGSVAGQAFDYELWKTILAVPEGSLTEALREGVQAGIIKQIQGTSRLEFTHVLLCDVLYQRLLLPERRRLHQQIAEHLEQQTSPAPDIIAGHYQLADDPREFEWLVKAGERAWRSFAWKTAAERYTAAIAILERDPVRRRDLGWLCLRLGFVYVYQDIGASLINFERATAIGREVNNRMLVAYSLCNHGSELMLAGEYSAGLRELEESAAHVDELTLQDLLDAGEYRSSIYAEPIDIEPGNVAQLQNMSIWLQANPARGHLTLWLAVLGRFEAALKNGQQFLSEAELATTANAVENRQIAEAVGDTWFGLGLAAAALARPEEARQAFRKAGEAFSALQYRSMVAFMQLAELIWVNLVYETNDLTRRRLLAQRIRREHLRLDSDEGIDPSSRHILLQWLRVLEGDWAEAQPAPQPMWEGVWIDYAYCRVMRYQGNPEQAWNRINACIPNGPAESPGTSPPVNTMLLMLEAIRLQLDAGDLTGACAWLKNFERWLEHCNAIIFRPAHASLRARYRLTVCDLSAAAKFAEQAIRIAEEQGQPLALVEALLVAGEIKVQAGNDATARRKLQRALDTARRSDAPLEQALALAALAELEVDQQNQSAAREHLNQATELCQQIGVHTLLDRIRNLQQRSQPAPDHRLTPRQLEVLRLIAEGKSDREIGEALYISPRTVMRHVSGILNALGVESRTAAATVAIREDII